jgi:hypothetical protein
MYYIIMYLNHQRALLHHLGQHDHLHEDYNEDQLRCTLKVDFQIHEYGNHAIHLIYYYTNIVPDKPVTLA